MYVKAAQRQRSIFHIFFQHNDKKSCSLFIEKRKTYLKHQLNIALWAYKYHKGDVTLKI